MNSLLLILLAASFAEQPADDPADASIARLVEQLDAETFELRERAERSLREIGLPARKHLQRARDSKSAEVRSRARRLLATIQSEFFRSAFGKLVNVKSDQEIDLERAMFLMATALDADVDEQAIDRQLDDLAQAVRQQLQGKVPARADPREVVQAFCDVLFQQQGFTGNRANYDSPENSSIAYVLEEKKGLPILLSHVMVAVAQRLDVPIVGVPVPGKYMVKYDGRQAPAGFAKQDIVISPFDDFKEMSTEDLKQFFANRGSDFDPQRDLQASTHHATVVRLLANLISDLQHVGKAVQAEQIDDYRDVVLQQTFGEEQDR